MVIVLWEFIASNHIDVLHYLLHFTIDKKMPSYVDILTTVNMLYLCLVCEIEKFKV